MAFGNAISQFGLGSQTAGLLPTYVLGPEKQTKQTTPTSKNLNLYNKMGMPNYADQCRPQSQLSAAAGKENLKQSKARLSALLSGAGKSE